MPRILPIPFASARAPQAPRLGAALLCSLTLIVGLLCWSSEALGQACPGEGDPCDGPDSDLCLEGVITCAGTVPICGDVSGDDLDSCDGFDNDCNPATADGADEPSLDDPCDGPDTDLCEEGVTQCIAASITCSDATGNGLDLCDGADNDCNPSTPDGADEPNLGSSCDGPDTDLCVEGVFECIGASMLCTDTSGDNEESCDGVDNDCDPSTADGSGDPGLGAACDGPDTDLCEEGLIACVTGALTCSDSSPDNLESCDGADNDCNPSTPDGADEPNLGSSCDGPDTDLCVEGVFECVGASMLCTDTSGDNEESCDGVDNDCDPSTADGSGDPGLGVVCDGPDGDLCEEGYVVCEGASLVCSDDTGDDPVCAAQIAAAPSVALWLLALALAAAAFWLLAAPRNAR